MAGIDFHAHLAPALDDATLAALDGVEPLADGRLALDGGHAGPAALYRPAELLAALGASALDAAVVSVPPPFFRQQLPAPLAAPWTRAINAGIIARTMQHPRLLPLAYLPLEHPELALAEYERLRDEPAFAGVVASAGGASVSLADARLEPLWQALDADARLLLLHPGSTPDPRLDAFYLANLLGNPLETSVAAAQLVLGNVLARHPRMRVLLVHCGGCVPALVGRWERGVATARAGVDTAIEPPRRAARRLYVDCLAHDAAVVDLAAQTFGEDKLVLGSDWPFPMGLDDPRSAVAHRDAAFARRVAVENAAAALGRPASVQPQATSS